MDTLPIRRALISVSDKLGLGEFARGLAACGVEIYSTGGTRKYLEDQGITVHDVSAYTGFPEMMDGRLKTLHPKVFGGILCRHDREDDMAALKEHEILTFELVVVNLYPFEATIARPDVTESQAIEKIDIGGPSLVRAAAKNHAFVTIATSPMQYAEILSQVQANGGTDLALRKRLAAEAFAHTAKYDQAIAGWFAGQTSEGPFPGTLTTTYRRQAVLRYGENPHQQAALYAASNRQGPNLISGVQLHGKELSYNNLLDLDAALEIVRHFDEPAVAVLKHNNPCGAAVADTLVKAAEKAMAGDPVSAFGSILGINRIVDVETAELLAQPGLFIEAIVAPDFQLGALEILTTKPKWHKNVRLIKVGELDDQRERWTYRYINGGLLMQEADNGPDDPSQWKVVTEAQPDETLTADLQFAWAIVRFLKSNAIALCKDGMLVGAGAGQMSRVDSVEIAIKKAGDRVDGSVLASDAFFPFPDSIEHAAAAGVKAVIQPGGSIRDQEVIDACNKHGLPMIFTGRRHFRH
ncbi:MAG: bifunctional phosphoribosylaminoimidazolecarboxamide formyltransferase/IMP cyclohydrolase PurH [Planctomycetota bacterium]|nr:MAG: bifunctional phosphoribosylaminoimidazolecarboxamide formyltransferase/IMP cyclohydrolase PurH [Planctomycetota bacterium]